MNAITTRLRDFARGVKEQHQPVDLFEPIHDALFIMDHRLRHANIMVSQKIAMNHHWIVGDRNQMVQVFLNLFSNACDAMDTCETRVLTVEVSPVIQGGVPYCCCTVKDTGTGISKANQERVFASFFTTKPRGKGTGLGLSIVSTIIREHGGTIRLESEEGKGTTFLILLPCRST